MSNPTNRYPPIDPQNYTQAQSAGAASLSAGPRGEVRGPFVPLLYSPELLDRAQKLGEFLRYQCAVPEALREFAILITARHWRQTYEWHVHVPFALKAGIAPDIINRLAAGEKLTDLSPAQRAIYRFCRSVHEQGHAPDDIFADARELLGPAGVIDLLGLCGYYAMLAMVLNVAQTPVPNAPPYPFS